MYTYEIDGEREWVKINLAVCNISSVMQQI